MTTFVSYTVHKNYHTGETKEDMLNWAYSTHGREKLHKICARSLKGRCCLGSPEVDGRMILKCMLNKQVVIMGIGFYSSLRMPIIGGLLYRRYWNFGFGKSEGIFEPHLWRISSEEFSVPCSYEWTCSASCVYLYLTLTVSKAEDIWAF